ncbi:MAG: hypothetical protein FJY91_02680 [Candidatus Harrisonbacteria bacterium]|nr:hypothetical protein [Candidatus Harrisonbacteria bacterium]
MNNILGKIITFTVALFLGLISSLPLANAQSFWDSFYYPGSYGYNNFYDNYGYNFGYNYQNSYYQPVNQPPVFLPIASQNGRVNQYLSFTISAYDPDGSQPVTYSAVSLPSGASFNTSSRTFSWTPLTAGVYSAIFRASDCATCYSELEVRITIEQPVVNPPTYYPPTTCGTFGYPSCPTYPTFPVCTPVTFTGTPLSSAQEGKLYTHTVTASGSVFSPYTNPSQITFRVIEGPLGFSINNYSGTIVWVPTFAQGGTSYAVKIGAKNNCMENVLSYVIYVQDIPLISPTTPATVIKKETEKTPICETKKVEKKEVCIPVTIATTEGNTTVTVDASGEQSQTPTPVAPATNSTAKSSISDAFVVFFNSLFASPLLLLICLILLFLLFSERRKYESREAWNRIERNYERLKKDKEQPSDDFVDLPRP